MRIRLAEDFGEEDGDRRTKQLSLRHSLCCCATMAETGQTPKLNTPQ